MNLAYPQPHAPARFSIDIEEWTAILTSIVAIALTMTFQNGGIDVAPGQFVFLMAVFTVTVGSGFLLHELAHKYVAVRFGCRARYEAWTWGLVLMLALAILPQLLFHMRLPLFLAPGAVMIWAGTGGRAHPITRRENGLISLAGPLTNLLLAGVFLGLTLLSAGAVALGEIGEGSPLFTVAIIASMGVRVNLFLALFNLLPIFPLDGVKVAMWDWRVWLALFGVAFAGTAVFSF